MERKVKTPCVGVCSTVFGDQVCRGCKRFHHEVIEWNGYTDIQKETVWNRLESLKVLIMKSKICLRSGELIVTNTRLKPIDLETTDNKAHIGINIRLSNESTSIIRCRRMSIVVALIEPSIAEYNNWDFTSTEVLTRSAVKPPFLGLIPLIPAFNELEKTP